ncbi:MAG: hypothetical protein ACYC6M_05015 [Terriglobales bacterium]
MKLRRVKRRSYAGLSRKTWTIIGYSAGAVAVAGVGYWLYSYLTSPPSGSIVTSTGQVITPAQQAQLLTPVPLVA